MFCSFSNVGTGLTSSEGEYLAITTIFTGLILSAGGFITNIFTSTGLILSEGEYLINSTVLSGLVQGSGNFQATLNAFFPPNHFTFIFGANASQNINRIVIAKSDLLGLTLLENNTAESLIVGIISQVLFSKSIVEFPGITFKYWGYGRTAEGKRIDTVLIDIRNKLTPTNIYELPEISSTINPNDY